MKNLLTLLFIIGISINPNISFAWITSDNANIVGVIMHEEGIGRDETIVMFRGATQDFNCHIKNTEKNLTSLALSLYMAGKKVQVHCYNTQITIGSFNAYKMHRIIGK